MSSVENKSDGSQNFEEGQETWAQNTPRAAANVATPPAGKFPMLNGTNVHFESPKVPVIFVLGGPGSGKVTHCDNLMQEKKGVTHINMTDLLQQYAIGNDMPDFGLLSSKTVTEVLMLEMKMAPNAKTYLVSGYPRNMRDVVEYSEKIQTVQGVILISWRQKVLERQIDYGAKLGQVVLSLARMELNNFYRNVLPVAEYFDQSNMLISINGERVPADVYQDFRDAVIRILGMQDNPPVFANGKVAPVPDDVVSTELPLVILNNAFFFTYAGEKIRVCKSFFMATLCINSQVIETILRKQNNEVNGIIQADNRGRHEKHSVPEELKEEVRSHIDLFLEWRATTADLNQRNNTLKEEKLLPTCTEIMSSVGFINASEVEKQELQEQYNNHIEDKELARKEKDMDKNSPDKIDAVYDMQAALPCPQGDSSSFYYVSKLSVYNLTLYELKSTDEMYFMWHEGLAHRGANEVGSCVWNYLKSVNDKNSEMNVYAPDKYVTLVRQAKKHGNPFNVHEMGHENFFDLKQLSSDMGIKDSFKTEGDGSVPLSGICVLKVTKENPSHMLYKMSYKEQEFKTINVLQSKRRLPSARDVTLKQAYKKKPVASTTQMTSIPHSERLQKSPERPKTRVISVNPSTPNFRSPTKAYPPVLWVIGGPGSNKAALCASVANETGWQHVSLGKILRTLADQPDAKKNKEVAKLRECISNGELVPQEFIMRQVEKVMADNMEKDGLILDGYPRDMAQVAEFEARYKQKPAVILLDCSKLQLGRGRLDDSVTAFRRRLEIFRQSSLPMLRAMDSIGRLTIVDGDTDTPSVQADFRNVVKEHIEYLKTQSQETSMATQNGYVANGHIPNGHAISNGHIPQDTQVQDLDDEPIDTISKQVSNGVNHMANGSVKTHTNGFISNGVGPYNHAHEIEGHI
ncbi:uncharacterized protein LOC114324154 [Diabrotica virgifera virgifera]|uniref:Adenylate kinase isoenzyme 5 n=1 Tax=Diabrotica virgifera virgifera TaxID=50390 RepID=A0ABM5L2R8_DIAVI|nr:uncharacterized protein LOC114324154 [Diabrotica virgifera virgifera]